MDEGVHEQVGHHRGQGAALVHGRLRQLLRLPVHDRQEELRRSGIRRLAAQVHGPACGVPYSHRVVELPSLLALGVLGKSQRIGDDRVEREGHMTNRPRHRVQAVRKWQMRERTGGQKVRLTFSEGLTNPSDVDRPSLLSQCAVGIKVRLIGWVGVQAEEGDVARTWARRIPISDRARASEEGRVARAPLRHPRCDDAARCWRDPGVAAFRTAGHRVRLA